MMFQSEWRITFFVHLLRGLESGDYTKQEGFEDKDKPSLTDSACRRAIDVNHETAQLTPLSLPCFQYKWLLISPIPSAALLCYESVGHDVSGLANSGEMLATGKSAGSLPLASV